MPCMAYQDTPNIPHKALQRLATEGTHISALRQMQFEHAMHKPRHDILYTSADLRRLDFLG